MDEEIPIVSRWFTHSHNMRSLHGFFGVIVGTPTTECILLEEDSWDPMDFSEEDSKAEQTESRKEFIRICSARIETDSAPPGKARKTCCCC